MDSNIKPSKFAGCDISALKEILRNIDKNDDPEFYDEINTLIIGKEFGEMSDDINEENGFTNESAEPTATQIPEPANDEEEFHMGVYNGYDIRELKSLLRKTSKKEKPKFYDALQTLIVTREFGNMSKSVGRVAPPDNNPLRGGSGGFTASRSNRRVGGSGLYNR